MRYKMYAVALASVLAVASTGCQAIKMNSCGSGSGSAMSGPSGGACNQASCGCQNCRNGMCNPSQMEAGQAHGFAGQGGGMLGADGQAGAFGAGGIQMNGGRAGGGIDLSACQHCSRLGRPCETCLAPGGRLAGLAGGAAGKARGLLGGLINRAAARDCQTPHTQPFAESGLPGGPMTATYGYPYYTTRAPRDFFTCNPPSIGP